MRDTSRIVADPLVCSGKPVIRGSRVMVRNILSMLRSGETVDGILLSYPGLIRADVEAAADYAIDLIDDVRLIQVG